MYKRQDEDNRHALGLELVHSVEQLLGLIGVEAGGRLVQDQDSGRRNFEGAGDGRVAKGKGLHYDPDAGRVAINAGQHFAPVSPEVWQYQVGGYQVCHKWLKDRAERQLSLAEVRTYCRIVTALARTIEVQRAIDAVYGAVEDSALARLA